MAIDQGTETVAITTQERTWRITIDTPKGGDPTVTIHRQIVRTLPDGSVLSIEAIEPPVRRSLSVVAAQTIAVSGQPISGAATAGLLAAWADTWRQEDIAAAEAAAAAAQQQQQHQQQEET